MIEMPPDDADIVNLGKLPWRAEKALWAFIKLGIQTVGDLRDTPDATLLAIPGVGRKTLAAFREQAPNMGPMFDGLGLPPCR